MFRRALAVGFLAGAVAWTAPLSPATEQPAVRIRLFSEVALSSVAISPSHRLLANDRWLAGPFHVERRGPSLWVRSPGQPAWNAGNRLILGEDDELLLSAHGSLRRLNGRLEIRARRNRSLELIGMMDVEDYVLGVVEPELGSLDAPRESLKAQIVASRSYLLSMRGRHWGQGYDFCDSPHCQAYTGLGTRQAALQAAAGSVRGKYLAYQGRPVAAFFHDCCGGSTIAADQVWPVTPVAYLRTIRDGREPYCRFAPKARWRFAISLAGLRRALSAAGRQEAPSLSRLQVVRRDDSGRARWISLDGDSEARLPAQALRRAVNRYAGSEVLPSLLFTIHQERGRVIFEGRGWGHGVGLCQWGAMEMAKEGKTYQEILDHYFPGTHLESLPVPIFASNTRSGA